MSLTVRLGANVEASGPQGDSKGLAALRTHEDLHKPAWPSEDVLDTDVLGVDALIARGCKQPSELTR